MVESPIKEVVVQKDSVNFLVTHYPTEHNTERKIVAYLKLVTQSALTLDLNTNNLDSIAPLRKPRLGWELRHDE